MNQQKAAKSGRGSYHCACMNGSKLYLAVYLPEMAE